MSTIKHISSHLLRAGLYANGISNGSGGIGRRAIGAGSPDRWET